MRAHAPAVDSKDGHEEKHVAAVPWVAQHVANRRVAHRVKLLLVEDKIEREEENDHSVAHCDRVITIIMVIIVVVVIVIVVIVVVVVVVAEVVVIVVAVVAVVEAVVEMVILKSEGA